VGPDSDVDSSGLTSLTGWDVRGGSAVEHGVEAFERSALSDPDTESRYELLAVASRGFRPPRFLMTADLSDEASAARPHGADVGRDGGHEVVRQAWSLLYRRVAETQPRTVVPYAIYLLGVNPPAGVTDEELEVFNDFYTNVHLPEVAERRHALRAERYELVREVRAPHQGAPLFVAIYEVDEEAASKRRHTGPPYSTGPEVWKGHKTPWRLWYRRLGSGHSQAS
jgi:hypothetical protein